MASLKITGTIETFTEVMMPKYSQVDDLLVIGADGHKTLVSMLCLRNDLLMALRQAQVDGNEIELFIDKRPKLIGRHQLFGLKNEHMALFDKVDPGLVWSAIPSVMVLVGGWLTSIYYFQAHFDVAAFVIASIIVQFGLLAGSMWQFVPLSLFRFFWLLAKRTNRKKIFYGDDGEAARTKSLEPSTI